MEAEEEDVDENGKSKTPPTCYEPCTYLEYSYDLSRGEFPTRKYWDGYLDKLVRHNLSYTSFVPLDLGEGLQTNWIEQLFDNKNGSYDTHYYSCALLKL